MPKDHDDLHGVVILRFTKFGLEVGLSYTMMYHKMPKLRTQTYIYIHIFIFIYFIYLLSLARVKGRGFEVSESASAGEELPGLLAICFRLSVSVTVLRLRLASLTPQETGTA